VRGWGWGRGDGGEGAMAEEVQELVPEPAGTASGAD
jgi:hypothetical protein